ncbi:hypothetical protein [Azorhizobium caulinodans]|uniref:hypothetical protein n=1 Tax=Azorhizobium caulinodans TaxID=7 RepID=UPI002FBF037A
MSYTTCQCSDPDCVQNGCKLTRGINAQPFYPARQPPSRFPTTTPSLPTVWRSEPAQKGCICPPTSEQTCQRSDCGRKDVRVTVGADTTPKEPDNA